MDMEFSFLEELIFGIGFTLSSIRDMVVRRSLWRFCANQLGPVRRPSYRRLIARGLPATTTGAETSLDSCFAIAVRFRSVVVAPPEAASNG